MVKILVAEDDPEIQELLRFTLENEGYTVTTASDGVEALQKAYDEKPDLLMLDVQMPKMNGFEVCDKVRKNHATSSLPVIMLTSLSRTTDRITGIKLGADEYICKPFEPIEVIARIEGLLRRVKMDTAVNSLSGLPGSLALEKQVEVFLANKNQFALLYADFNNFKSFNEKFGFEKGNEIIKSVSKLFIDSINELGLRNSFVYHLGGDDFVVLTVVSRGEELSRKIMASFDSFLLLVSGEESARRNEKMPPLISISIGILNVNPDDYQHYLQIVEQAKVLWNIAKSKGGSGFISG